LTTDGMVARPVPRHSSSGPVLLALRGLRKSVPGGRVLFEGLDLTLRPGEFVAIKGESGVGKSTLLNLIAGLDAADSGTIAVNGVELEELDDDARTLIRRECIGFVFQAFHVLPHLSLAQNVALPLVLQHVPAAEAESRAVAMLASVGLGGRGGDYPRQLSGGELQRVAIARALVHRPQLILADEPTGNLDPDTAKRILELFATEVRGSGTATLLVTHSDVAAAVADRTLTLTRQGLVERRAQ
jgi:putative ABC transport system ATP-binding protein